MSNDDVASAGGTSFSCRLDSTTGRVVRPALKAQISRPKNTSTARAPQTSNVEVAIARQA